MKRQLFYILLIALPFSGQSQLNINRVVLPQCKSFIFPQCCIEEDGVYHEFYPEDSLVTRFEYTLAKGKRTGTLNIYNKKGELVARGNFRKDRLENGSLTIYEDEGAQNVKLKYDAPGWFMASHWICRSGTGESDANNHFVWLAGQRYRLPEGVVELNF